MSIGLPHVASSDYSLMAGFGISLLVRCVVYSSGSALQFRFYEIIQDTDMGKARARTRGINDDTDMMRLPCVAFSSPCVWRANRYPLIAV